MRITVDQDYFFLPRILWTIFKHFIITRRLPNTIKKTSRGLHYISYGHTFGTRNIHLREKKMLVARKFLSDDKTRLRLDMNPKRVTQVLFTHKRVLRRIGNKIIEIKHCKACGMPLSHCFFYRIKTNEHFCVKCFNYPYRMEAKLRILEKILIRLGIKYVDIRSK